MLFEDPCCSRIQGGVSGLVAGTVFNTDERQMLSLAGSIPVRLRGHPSESSPRTARLSNNERRPGQNSD
jgi:hypothetical protein